MKNQNSTRMKQLKATFFFLFFCTTFSYSQNKILCTPPTVTPSSNATICNGLTATISATGSGTSAPYTYDWTPTTGLGCPTCSNTPASPTTTTTYTVLVTDAAFCTNTATVQVTVNTLPAIGIMGSNTICAGGITTLTGSGGVSYVWMPDGQITGSITVNPSVTTTYTLTGTDGNSCTNTDVDSIVVEPSPIANAGTDVSICLISSITLTATGNGTYLWSPSTGLSCTTCSNATVNPTVTTTYTVTVTTPNCGSIDDSVTVTINSLPSVDAGADATICLGGNTSLNAIGSGTFLWSPTTGLSCTTCQNPIANPTSTTNYTVTITDICGTASDSVWITIGNPVASVSGSATTVCSGSSTTLTASVGTSYSWSTGETINPIVVNPIIGTIYTVTVTSGGCSNDATITINVSSVTASVLGNTSICSGSSTTLTASVGTSYSWSTGETINPIVVNPTIGTTGYTVTVTNVSGCTGVATITVTVTAQPTATVSASTSTTLCSGSSTTLTAGGGTVYSWLPSTGLSSNNISSPIANPTSTMTYSVIVSNGGCSDTTSITLTINPVPTASVTAGSASICDGDSTLLTATGGTIYVWMPGGQTTTSIYVSPTSTQNYTVTVTNASACMDDVIVSVTVVAPVTASILPVNPNICAGSIITLTAQPAGSIYLWNTGGTDAVIAVFPTVTTTYSVIVSNGSCADSSASVTVNVTASPSANASANPYTIIFGNQTTLTASGNGAYNWNPTTGISCVACPNPIANPTVTTTYTVTVIDSLTGCSAIDTVIVNVITECDDIFVPNAFSPFNGDGKNDYAVLHIPPPCLKLIDFSIYNRWGQKVFFTDDPMITVDKTKGWDGVFQGKDCDPAVFFYILNVTFANDEFKQLTGNITLVR